MLVILQFKKKTTLNSSHIHCRTLISCERVLFFCVFFLKPMVFLWRIEAWNNVLGIGLCHSLAGTKQNKTNAPPQTKTKTKSHPIIHWILLLQIHKCGKFDSVLLDDGWPSYWMRVCPFHSPVTLCSCCSWLFLGCYVFIHLIIYHTFWNPSPCATQWGPYLNFQNTSSRPLQVCNFVSQDKQIMWQV